MTLSNVDAKRETLKLFPGVKQEEIPFLEALIAGVLSINPANSDDSKPLQKMTLIFETLMNIRGYLALHQVNGVWGASMTAAVEEFGKDAGINPYFVNPAYPSIGGTFLRALLSGKINKVSPEANSPLFKQDIYGWAEYQVRHANYLEPRFNHFPTINVSKHWRTGPMEMNFVAIRGFVNGKQVRNLGNQWNDQFILAWVDKAGVKRAKVWAGSTDPGWYYYGYRPINRYGTAHAAPQQLKYVAGPHNGKPAFVQAWQNPGASDGNIISWRLNGPTESITSKTPITVDNPGARYWQNIHPGFAFSDSAGVDASSAGCLVAKAAGWTDPRWISFRDTAYLTPGSWMWATILDSRYLVA